MVGVVAVAVEAECSSVDNEHTVTSVAIQKLMRVEVVSIREECDCVYNNVY